MNNLEYNDNPVCPHCQQIINIDEFEFYHFYNEDEQETTCPYCEKDFMVVGNAKWTFTTSIDNI
jgi:uncharacterized Zn-finger protein